MSAHILVVEDDTLMRRSLSFGLQRAGYRVSSAERAEAGLELARIDPPDLVLLDIGLPGMDGLKALVHFKEQSGIPVIFLTARRRELDEVIGLELGADDYITKPISLDLLLARVKAMLRRLEGPHSPTGSAGKQVVGDLVIDPLSHSVTVAGRPVVLTRREFNLLHLFAKHPGEALSIEQLLVNVWGAEFTGQPQVVYVHIRWLRKKIELDPENPRWIVTIHGVGYKLQLPEA
ncbi:MAG: response regulator transcription factor [Chloroflexota bacterium]